MIAPPPAFRAELRSHNFHAVGTALASLLGAVVAWCLAYFLFVLIVFGLVTAVRGDLGPDVPVWIRATACASAAALLVWGTVDNHRRRFNLYPDRSIIGWHLFEDILLLPVRLTFAVWGNLGAMRRLGEADLSQAWELLMTILQAGQARLSSLTLIEPDPARLHHLLSTLQLLGYIDLHRSERDWFYAICSPREPELRSLAGELPQA